MSTAFIERGMCMYILSRCLTFCVAMTQNNLLWLYTFIVRSMHPERLKQITDLLESDIIVR